MTPRATAPAIVTANVSRRHFLGGVFAAGAFVVAARFVPESLLAQTGSVRTPADLAALHPSVYLGLDPDGTVHIVTHRSEMGTGIRTSLPMVAADELDADWARVKIAQGIGDARYGDQNTDGSKSIRDFFDAFRQAGASARVMLVEAAAAQWQVPVAECEPACTKSCSNRGRRAACGAPCPQPPVPCRSPSAGSSRARMAQGSPVYDLADIVSGKAASGWTPKWTGW